ncbi:MAG: hypothetical protein COB73_00925 [Flavobacteriaceae bacterium]|nr:MAG: hypothetical protein COB73_00925 [Flavobacteriaceae bacterium]
MSKTDSKPTFEMMKIFSQRFDTLEIKLALQKIQIETLIELMDNEKIDFMNNYHNVYQARSQSYLKGLPSHAQVLAASVGLIDLLP